VDIYCKRCGEPWDVCGVFDGDMTPAERERILNGEGCPCCYGKEVQRRPFRAELTSALHGILGDDIDGLAAELEDAESMLGEKFWE